MKKQTDMAQMVVWYGVAVCIGFLVAMGAGAFAITKLEVGGPIYATVVDSKDLTADILPPPLYNVELQLATARAVNGQMSRADYATKTNQLKKDYDARLAFWKAKKLAPAIQAGLASIDTGGQKQWKILQGEFTPALQRQDAVAIQAAYAKSEVAFQEHNKAVEALVPKLLEAAEASEKAAASESRFYMTVLAVVCGVVLGILGLGLVIIRQRIVSLTAAEARNKKALYDLADQFEGSVGAVVDVVASAATELESTARSMESTASQTSAQSTAVAAAAEQATTNVSVVATSADEMGKSVSEIAQQVAQSASIASDAVNRARTTGETMEQLSRSAEKIGDVVSLISDIAAQTNLLALNATIESARAGEAGKGFAVVASEVKNLATQTAKATDEIASQIEEMQNISRTSVTAIAEIQRIIDDMNSISVTINAAVEEQSAATHEIARSTNEAANGAHDVAHTIAQVLEAAQHTGAASSEVVCAAQQLGEQAELLRGEVSSFLKNVRAA